MILFPMAGESRRFRDAGYSVPKYMLPVGNGYAFDYSVAGFLEAFAGEPFVFVYRETGGVLEFLENRTSALNIPQSRYVRLETMTAGQAETVEKGLSALAAPDDEPLTIFNIDTFRTNVRKPAPGLCGDGYLEVFRGEGANWSFVEPASGEGAKVLRTAEKDPISDLCCTGLYHFRSLDLFRSALVQERVTPATQLRELYVAPIYNHLIRRGADIRYDLIDRDEVVFCGVPMEYEALRSAPPALLPFPA